MDKGDRAARIVRTIVETLKPGFAVRLWTGERIGPPAGPTLILNRADIVQRSLRRPNLSTIVEMWASKAIDIEGGSLFDFFERRPEGLRAKLKTLPMLSLLRDLPLVLLAGKPVVTNTDLAGRDPFVSGSSAEAIRHHYDISNAFYQLFLDQRMVYSCGYFADFANDIDQAQADKLDNLPQAAAEAGRAPAGHRLRLGCDVDLCGETLRGDRTWCVPVRTADRTGARTYSGRRTG